MLGGIGGRRRRGQQRMRWLGWHHWLDGHESEWTPGVGDGQGSLACCDWWGHKELDTTERLNWTEQKPKSIASIIRKHDILAWKQFCFSLKCVQNWAEKMYIKSPIDYSIFFYSIASFIHFYSITYLNNVYWIYYWENYFFCTVLIPRKHTILSFIYKEIFWVAETETLLLY